MMTHQNSLKVARHACGILYFLALDLLREISTGGSISTSSSVTPSNLIDAVVSSLHRHATKGGIDLIAPALGFLRALAMDDVR